MKQAAAAAGAAPTESLSHHRTIAFVPQEAYIFTGTVRENLAYLQPQVGDDAIVDAVERFGLELVVTRLGGLDAVIAPGGDALSAGERQQMALARTWLSPASIVVLDEATCHLDPEAEEAAESQLRARGGTLIVVAHRISSAMRADRVAIVETGLINTDSHQRLVERNVTYARLVDYWDAIHRVDAGNVVSSSPVPGAV